MVKETKDTKEHTPDRIKRALSKTGIRKGLLYFVILTVVGLAILFFYTNTPQSLAALHHLRPWFLVIAVFLSGLDMLLGGWRNHIFVRKIKPGVTSWLCFRANLANIFLGAVTPSQTGGGPAQLFVLYRAGISLADGVSIGVINFICTLGFFLVAAAFSLTVVQGHFSQAAVRYLIRYSFFAFAGLFVLFTLALWHPELLARTIGTAANQIGKLKQSWNERTHRFSQRMAEEIGRYHRCCTRFLRDEPLVFLSAFGITALLYLNKFTLAYFLMRGLGITGNYLTMIAIQTLVLFILYFSPTPGGSGIAELSIGALMSLLMPKYLLPIFTLLHRFFLLYLPAALGCFILIAELKSQAKSQRK